MNKELSSILNKIQKTRPNIVKNSLDAGTYKRIILDSPQLNYILGGSFVCGKIYSGFGPFSGGKTVLFNYMCGQLQKKMPEGQQNIIYGDFERSFNYKYASENGLDCSDIHDGGKLLYLQPDTMEDFFDTLSELVPTRQFAGIIFDSESAAPFRAAFTDAAGKANFGTGAKLLGEGLRKLSILCANYDTSLFIISQERAQMAMMSRAIATTGGYALPYYASWRSRITKIQTIENGKETIGQEIKIRNYKSKIGVPFRTAEMKLYFKGGFDTNNEYIDFLILFGIIKQAGAYFKSDKYNFSLQGRPKLIEWMNSHPDIYAELKKDCDEAIMKETDLDSNNTDPNPELSDELSRGLKQYEENLDEPAGELGDMPEGTSEEISEDILETD
jgi:recombination protein RecA